MLDIKKYTGNQTYLAVLLDALSHPARLLIVEHLAEYDECPAGKISEKLPLSKSTVSQHLTKLKEAGLITCSPYGICQHYKLEDERVIEAMETLQLFLKSVNAKKDHRKCCG
ncbi:MAG: metalloregulator ArsR/SmtB family transcription factor [Bacteroidales bacterium]|nr:metalloregulator ArsR/SmtB family transcription factor [Bacteroidales bacterium]